MQTIEQLSTLLAENANKNRGLFRLKDLRSLCPHLTNAAFRTMLSRTVSSGQLVRICRNIYLVKKALSHDGLILFHVAALIRANNFNYVSLETVLSDAGIISQIPINRISLMSSGRTNIISCGDFGTIEFVHTDQKPAELASQLIYDFECGLWRANIALAIRDMKATHRNLDLIDWDIANEFI